MRPVESLPVAATITYEKKKKGFTEVHVSPALTHEEKRSINYLYLWPKKIRDDDEKSTLRAYTLIDRYAALTTANQVKHVFARTRRGDVIEKNPEIFDEEYGLAGLRKKWQERKGK